jgi:hypothetical protein
LLTLTVTLEILVPALALMLLACTDKLHAYAPTYSTLIDPPCALAPQTSLEFEATALQLKQLALLTLTVTLEILVPALALVLLACTE